MAKGDIKRRREVERLSASLPRMTEDQRWEAEQKCGTAWIGARMGWCDVCGREFEHELWGSRKKSTVCPKCGTKVALKKSPDKKRESSMYYFHIVTAIEGWQVVRTFHCHRIARRVEKFGTEILRPSEVEFYVTEVFQKFIKENTVPMVIGLGTRGMSYYLDQWKWDSGWKLRTAGGRAYTVWGWVAKKPEILPELKRRGLKRMSDGCSPYEQIEKVMHNWQAEVLLKHGAQSLFDLYIRDSWKVTKYWPSVRIALRHKYAIRNAGMWVDYLHLLKEEGKDLRNPHYICPDNLRKAHDVQLEARERRREKARRAREEEEARRLAEQLSEDGKTNLEYIARMGKVLGVMVRRGDITLQPMQSIRDFFEEGSALHHCVFRNGYYKHDHCLIIGAKVRGRRTETIELNTKDWRVVQCRGTHNQPSRHHDRILRVLKDNMDKFRRATV